MAVSANFDLLPGDDCCLEMRYEKDCFIFSNTIFNRIGVPIEMGKCVVKLGRKEVGGIA